MAPETSLEARIAELQRQYQERSQARQTALQEAQRAAEEMLRLEGAFSELTRLKEEVWAPEVVP